MIVAGGYYLECCVKPREESGFGSGGRAAMAIASAGEPVDWYYFCPPEERDRISASLAHEYITHRPHDSQALVSFRYFHPLSLPVYSPSNPARASIIEVSGEVVLRFGFMEGDARVKGGRVVYDPQAPNDPAAFSENGSTANDLAIVLNAKEVHMLGKSDDELMAVKRIGAVDGANVVLVKAGAEGCRVYQAGELQGTVPPYASERVYKIGSGDVFSAAFAYHWGVIGRSTLESAEIASRCTSRYCATRFPSAKIDSALNDLEPVVKRREGKIYIAGPFFTVGELWVIEEAWKALSELGVPVFSPYHDIGFGPADQVAKADLEGLDRCTAVLAFIDGCDSGTIFEIGYARSNGIPVVALSENPKTADLTMLKGTDCFLTDDFCTAVYRAAWDCWR